MHKSQKVQDVRRLTSTSKDTRETEAAGFRQITSRIKASSDTSSDASPQTHAPSTTPHTHPRDPAGGASTCHTGNQLPWRRSLWAGQAGSQRIVAVRGGSAFSNFVETPGHVATAKFAAQRATLHHNREVQVSTARRRRTHLPVGARAGGAAAVCDAGDGGNGGRRGNGVKICEGLLWPWRGM